MSGNGDQAIDGARPGVIEAVTGEGEFTEVHLASLAETATALRQTQDALSGVQRALRQIQAAQTLIGREDTFSLPSLPQLEGREDGGVGTLEPLRDPDLGGAERAVVIPGHSYRGKNTLQGYCTRKFVHGSVVARWKQLINPPNIAVGNITIVGHEVGIARQAIVEHLLSPRGEGFEYLMFLDDDLLVDADGWMKLIKWTDRFRCVAGLYYTKGAPNVPLAYMRDPEPNSERGVWRPVHQFTDWTPGSAIVVDGTGCGFTIFHRSLFEEIEPPWFQTVVEIDEESDSFRGGTEDLYFFEKCKRKWGEDFKVLLDTAVRCGHLVTSGPDEGKVF